MDHDLTTLPEDLRPIAARLRDERPQISPLQLDAVQRRLVQGRRRPEGPTLKTRLAMTAMLVVGLFTTTTGAGLAVSGLGTSGSAAVQQYGKSEKPGKTQNRPTVLGEEAENTPLKPLKPSPLQENRQVELGADAPTTGADELPFTGFAAIPVLVLGLGLLGGGFALRRRTS